MIGPFSDALIKRKQYRRAARPAAPLPPFTSDCLEIKSLIYLK